MSNISRVFSDFGQSIWLDNIDRNLLTCGGLKDLLAVGLRGVTSKPSIFHKAITGSADYDDSIRELLQADHEMDDEALYEQLTIQDVKMAADILQPVYASSDGTDGFVSLEVSPHIAFDADASIESARHLWRSVDRANLMIKVPATAAGLLAMETLIAEGINVNVTLLFSIDRYKALIDSYIRALSHNPHPDKVASLASFFISRVDAKVDAALGEIGTDDALALKGKIAIANAKLAYQYFKEKFASAAFKNEARRGAQQQRPLWASTSVKNAEYSDVLYVDQLIGSDTVNTLPPQTLDAFQFHGELDATLENDVHAAQQALDSLHALGIDLAQITEELEQEGIQKFADSYDQLLASLKDKRLLVNTQHVEK